MEENEPDEPREEGEVHAPDESASPGSEDVEDARLAEGDGRHLEAKPGICTWLYEMETDTFNMMLKIMFVFLLLITLPSLLIYSLVFHSYNTYETGGWLRGTGYVFGVYRDGINITLALLSALFALCVDVKKRGLKPRPVPRWMVRLAEKSAHKIKEFHHKTIDQTTAAPQSRAEDTGL